MTYVTGDQIVAHLIGDYLLQSHWMATEKTKRTVAALAHVATYVLPFLLLTRDARALAIIVGTHFFIDRFRLARFVVWTKNHLAPVDFNPEWHHCSKTGYPDIGTPDWLAVWLLIVADNTLHLICNAFALWVAGATAA